MAVINVGVYESINGWTGGWSGARTWTSQKIEDQSAFQNKVSCARQDTLTSADLNSNRAAFRSAATDAVNALDQGLGRSVQRAGQLESEALLSGSLARLASLGTLSDNLLMIDTRSGYGGFTALRLDPLSVVAISSSRSRLNAQHAALLQGVDQAFGITAFYSQRSDQELIQEAPTRLRSAFIGLTEPLIAGEQWSGAASSSAIRIDSLSGLDSVTGRSRLNAQHTALLQGVDQAAGILMFYAQKPESAPYRRSRRVQSGRFTVSQKP